MMEIGDVVQVRSDSSKRMWAGKIGKIVHIEQRPYGMLVFDTEEVFS